MGPTNKIVSELSNFIGTIARNPTFISLMYTSWHVVPNDTKKCMWEYINSKFLIVVEGKKWVMTGLRDAWRRHKQKIKENFFDKNISLEDMLAKAKKQKWRHQIEPINFARVRVALNILMFFLISFDIIGSVQPRTTTKNHQILKYLLQLVPRRERKSRLIPKFQYARRYQFFVDAELQNCQNSGETSDDAFRAMFGKEKPGLLRCYGRSVTTRCVGSNLTSPIDASSAQAVRGTNLQHSSGSSHNSVLQKESDHYLSHSADCYHLINLRPIWNLLFILNVMLRGSRGSM
ncbi:hypothetical protein H5410_003273, partial [Solanum commersonii]